MSRPANSPAARPDPAEPPPCPDAVRYGDLVLLIDGHHALCDDPPDAPAARRVVRLTRGDGLRVRVERSQIFEVVTAPDTGAPVNFAGRLARLPL